MSSKNLSVMDCDSAKVLAGFKYAVLHNKIIQKLLFFSKMNSIDELNFILVSYHIFFDYYNFILNINKLIQIVDHNHMK
jgi:hypothetical protein